MYFGLENISIKFGTRRILENITIDFAKGKITSIIGKNGCGKSSMLKTVSKAVHQETGNIIFQEKKLQDYKQKEIAKRIAILPQIHDVMPAVEVRTLISYGRYPHINKFKGLTKEDSDIIDNVMERMGLTAYKFRMLNTLSGGERQRAWIAMTLCQQPEVLILDEPTTFLDINNQIEILEIIKNLNEELGLTIIMVLHDINLSVKYSHYICAIKDAHVYAHTESHNIIDKKVLSDVFSVDSDIYTDERAGCPFFIAQKQNIGAY